MSRSRFRTAIVASAIAAGLATGGAVRADQVDVFVNYGGYDFCNVCNAADYTVPGLDTWNNGISTFADPVPAGAVITQMTARLKGTGDADVAVTVNGTSLGTSSIVGSTGACDTCYDGTPAASATYDAGFPGYVAGGSNTMQLSTPSTGLALDGVVLTIVYLACGDGNVAGAEECDTAGESATCDADCTLVVCGDGRVNAAAGEACDVTMENPACDADCTLAECGDEHVNVFAGEACDDGNTDDGDGCTAFCQLEDPSGGAGGGDGDGDGGGPSGGGGDGASGPSGPTADAVAGPGAGPSGGPGGDDEDEDGDAASDGGGDGGAGGTASEGSSSDGGCGCAVPGPDRRWAGGAFAAAALAVAALRRRARRARAPLGSAA